MLVEEVDVVDAEACETAIAGAPDVRGRGVEADAGPREAKAEFRRDDELLALVPDRTTEKPLVRMRPIDLGGVEEGDAEVDRAVDRRDAFRFGRGAVVDQAGADHRHASQAEGRDLETVA